MNRLLVTLFAASCAALLQAAPAAPAGLLTDLLAPPERAVIATARPTLGWIVNDPAPGAVQSAYQVVVASDEARARKGHGDVCDTGRVASAASINVPWPAAQPAQPGATYCWAVRTWDAAGTASPWSAVQRFTVTPDLAGAAEAVSHHALETARRAPRTIEARPDGAWFVDFGRAAFGWLEVTVDSPDAGRRIDVHLGESAAGAAIERQPPGSVRYAAASLTLAAGRHTYRVELPPNKRNTSGEAVRLPPELGVVLPFRYAELAGLAAPPAPGDLVQVVVQYPFDPSAAMFRSSDATLDAVWELSKYSIQATTFAGLYVDGDRERIPYEADAYINQLGHYATDREFSLARRTHEYFFPHPTWPTEWKQFSILMAWADYEQTGDARSLARSYTRLQREKLLLDHARPDGLLDTRTLRDLVDWPSAERDGFELKPVNTVVNAFHYRTLVLMARIAAVLGHAADATDYAARAERVRAVFNEKLLDAARGRYVDGEGSTHTALHASLFPLAFGLVPAEHRAAVVAWVKSRGMACSVYAAQFLLDGLFEAGEAEAALALITAPGDRSWRHMLERGTTITWEAWDQKYKPNLDWNHAWGAAPANVLPRQVLGVRALTPGWGTILVAPQPGPLATVEGRVPTIRGPVTVKFARTASGCTLDVVVPANTRARVRLPVAGRTTLDGAAVAAGEADVPSGSHRLEVRL